MSPDGSRFYVTDYYEAVLHVFDAETKMEILKIALPGVEPRDPTWLGTVVLNSAGDAYSEETFPFELMRPCASGVASTPDGAWVLVCSSAGLQVVDTATNQVVRTLSDVLGTLVAVSFDGMRAYVACDNLDSLAPRSYIDWIRTLMEDEECRLVCIDLKTWQIVKETPTATVAGLAVKPDDTQVFFSEMLREARAGGGRPHPRRSVEREHRALLFGRHRVSSPMGPRPTWSAAQTVGSSTARGN